MGLSALAEYKGDGLAERVTLEQETEAALSDEVREGLAFWRERLAQPSFVYVIRPDHDAAIKVGRAVDPVRRMASLQTGNWRTLRLLYVLPGSVELEWQLQNRLRGCRVLGEWFEGPAVDDFLVFVPELEAGLRQLYRGDGEWPNFMHHPAEWSPARKGAVRVFWEDPDTLQADERNLEERRRHRMYWEGREATDYARFKGDGV